MTEVNYRNRRAARVENENVRVTVLAEGGHVAEICHKLSDVNPLWTPPWPSIEPSTYSRAAHPEYGSSNEAYILSGLMGHSICLDTYGMPSPEEFAAGMPVHGEGPVVPYTVESNRDSISLSGLLPLAQIRFQRQIKLSASNSGLIHFRESLENLSHSDRPIAWTQHVTVGPPFLEAGKTQFRAPVTRSKVIDEDFTGGRGVQKTGAEFNGLLCPRKDGGVIDLRVYPSEAVSGGFTTHLVDPSCDDAFFLAWSPATKVLFGYVWKRADFPWICRWEENYLRADPPWNRQTMTCAMEFGVSPSLGSRRQMVERGSLFGTPGYRWLPALSTLQVEYHAFITLADRIPQSVTRDGSESVRFS
ncbi:MAG: hypothetical protein WCA38_09360 [Candidatus Acidiferrales bacterium]